MLTKTVTDDASLEVKKATVELKLPVINTTVFASTEASLNLKVKLQLLQILEDIIDAQLAK